MKTYAQKLQDPRWQKVRLRKLEEAGWSCEDCGDSASTLHVHHPRYYKGREPWEYEDDELVALCLHCHKRHTDDGEELKTLLADNWAMLHLFVPLIRGFVHGLQGGYPEPQDHPTLEGPYLAGFLAADLHENPSRSVWVANLVAQAKP